MEGAHHCDEVPKAIQPQILQGSEKELSISNWTKCNRRIRRKGHKFGVGLTDSKNHTGKDNFKKVQIQGDNAGHEFEREYMSSVSKGAVNLL